MESNVVIETRAVASLVSRLNFNEKTVVFAAQGALVAITIGTRTSAGILHRRRIPSVIMG